jgi:hypothetical protein
MADASSLAAKFRGADPALTRYIKDHLPPLPNDLLLECFIPLDLVAEVRNVSRDTVERDDAARVERGEASRIVQLSSRRAGMRIKHALLLTD